MRRRVLLMHWKKVFGVNGVEKVELWSVLGCGLRN